jgi:FkbM family methyltransferase
MEIKKDPLTALKAGVRQLLKLLTPAFKAGVRQHELERIFEQVYGRRPKSQELDGISSMPGVESETGAFRAIVRYFDHQTLPTGFSVRMSPLDVSVITTSGVKLAVDRADRSVSMPIATGVYEPHMRSFFESRLKPGMTFVDVGANVGLFTALAAKLVGEMGNVIAFEPNSENCRLILMSAQLNGFNNVKLIPVALHHEVGYALFTSGIGTNGAFIPSVDASLSNPSCTVVPTMKLDALIDGNVDFIKMDVEGAEGLVIKGAVRTIERCRPVITTEVSAEMLPRVSGVRLGDYLAWFDSMGYEPSLIDKATGNLIPITDTGAFAAEWGRLDRIEDLAFFPRS